VRGFAVARAHAGIYQGLMGAMGFDRSHWIRGNHATLAGMMTPQFAGWGIGVIRIARPNFLLGTTTRLFGNGVAKFIGGRLIPYVGWALFALDIVEMLAVGSHEQSVYSRMQQRLSGQVSRARIPEAEFAAVAQLFADTTQVSLTFRGSVTAADINRCSISQATKDYLLEALSLARGTNPEALSMLENGLLDVGIARQWLRLEGGPAFLDSASQQAWVHTLWHDIIPEDLRSATETWETTNDFTLAQMIQGSMSEAAEAGISLDYYQRLSVDDFNLEAIREEFFSEIEFTGNQARARNAMEQILQNGHFLTGHWREEQVDRRTRGGFIRTETRRIWIEDADEPANRVRITMADLGNGNTHLNEYLQTRFRLNEEEVGSFLNRFQRHIFQQQVASIHRTDMSMYIPFVDDNFATMGIDNFVDPASCRPVTEEETQTILESPTRPDGSAVGIFRQVEGGTEFCPSGSNTQSSGPVSDPQRTPQAEAVLEWRRTNAQIQGYFDDEGHAQDEAAFRRYVSEVIMPRIEEQRDELLLARRTQRLSHLLDLAGQNNGVIPAHQADGQPGFTQVDVALGLVSAEGSILTESAEYQRLTEVMRESTEQELNQLAAGIRASMSDAGPEEADQAIIRARRQLIAQARIQYILSGRLPIARQQLILLGDEVTNWEDDEGYLTTLRQHATRVQELMADEDPATQTVRGIQINGILQEVIDDNLSPFVYRRADGVATFDRDITF
ncbi:MAG: hypothetical protein KJ811_03905, partial [Candidatus Margulisbacteria bacterium]|nr:hypothetical protein [Candidatus Margulisiibacteriota bacterium]